MILLGEALFLAELVLLVYCVLNVLTTPAGEVRALPKLVWVVLIVLLPLVGGIAWLLVGRPARAPHSAPSAGGAGSAPAGPPRRATVASPDDDEAFLQSLRSRADAQRREAERQRQQAERAAREQAAREEDERRDAGGPQDPGQYT